MEKQALITQVLESFRRYSSDLPEELSVLFQQIDQKLQTYSEVDVVEETSRVETQPSSEVEFEADGLHTLLYEAYPFMQEIAKQADENQYELWQAVNLLRGELGMATDLPPDLA